MGMERHISSLREVREVAMKGEEGGGGELGRAWKWLWLALVRKTGKTEARSVLSGGSWWQLGGLVTGVTRNKSDVKLRTPPFTDLANPPQADQCVAFTSSMFRPFYSVPVLQNWTCWRRRWRSHFHLWTQCWSPNYVSGIKVFHPASVWSSFIPLLSLVLGILRYWPQTSLFPKVSRKMESRARAWGSRSYIYCLPSKESREKGCMGGVKKKTQEWKREEDRDGCRGNRNMAALQKPWM